MALAEGVQGSIRYKPYATGAITANTQPLSSTDPGASLGQVLRRVSSTLKLDKDTYQSAEIRADRQIADYRHGLKRSSGSITGELSAKTWFDFIEASCRGTKASAISFSNSDFTSVAADTPTSTFTFASGDAVAKGIRVGDIIQFTGLTATGNNGQNYLVTSITGANKVLGVSPAPTTMAADTTFSGTSNGATGKSIFVPSTNFVTRKFGIEEHFSDIDISLLYTECRIGGFQLRLPATGMATIEVPVMGRDMEIYTAANAPFYTAPAAAGTNGVMAAVNGVLRVAGVAVGVVTSLDINMNLNPTGDAVVGQNFPPEIFLGRANVTGQFVAFLQDETFLNYYKNETPISILAYLTSSNAANADAMSFYLPSLKLGDAAINLSGEAGTQITCPFQALKADGTSVGDEATTIRIIDSAAV